MNPEYTSLLKEGVQLLATVPAAWGGVKASLNGARADIREIKQDVKGIATTQAEQSTRIAVLEDWREHQAS